MPAARRRPAGADPREIVFTSGATESNNLAIKGVARFYAAAGKKHVVTTQTEHKCVLDACRTLEAGGGFDVTYLPVGTDGLVAPAAVAAALRPDTALVSVMGVNNEIGVVQPLAEIGALCRAAGVFFHTDAAQVRLARAALYLSLSLPLSLSPPTHAPRPSPRPRRWWARCR